MTQSSIATLTAPLLNTVSNMKSILLASNFLIVGHVLQNLCKVVTRSGKELKFVYNKTVKYYFETTHPRLFSFKISQEDFPKKPPL